jgi:hypothetical protein
MTMGLDGVRHAIGHFLLGLTRLEKQGADWRVVSVNEEPWTLPAD